MIAKSDRTAAALAADWMAKRDRGLSPAETAALTAWLAEHPDHARAFADCENAWRVLPKLRALPAEKMGALLNPPHPRHTRTRSPIWAAGLAAAALAFCFVYLRPATNEPIVGVAYSAGATADARFTLSDGSIADLRRGSEIQLIESDPNTFSVRLVRGEAHFTVTPANAGRFVVHAGQTAIRDLGTAFDVQLERGEIALLVTEGRVAVGPEKENAPPRIVSLGEAARLAENGDTRSIEVHPATAAEFERRLSWRHRRIVFSRTPLSQAVAEMNRYNFRRLVVADALTADVVVSGSFQSDNREAFVRLLDEGFDVAAETADGGQMILRKRAER